MRYLVQLCAAVLTSSAATAAVLPYKNAGLPVAQRVADLVQRMTLEEKVAQLQANSTLPAFPGLMLGPTPAAGIMKKGAIDEAVARRSLAEGIGVFSNITFTPITAADNVRQQNEIQNWVLANTRLGIPVIFQSEALHGAVILGATSFPQAVALGSTWDPALLRRMFTAVGREARGGGISMVLAPVFDLARDPRYGRVEEFYSEDPYLVGELGVAAVRGLQGSGPVIDQDHVIATAKHFVHGQPAGGLNTAPNDVSERTLREVYLPPFEKAVRAGIGAVMPSYNENQGGVPSHVDSWLLKDVLRGEWGFRGVTNSDWFAVAQLSRNHHVAVDDADAGVQAFNAGLDIETPNSAGFPALVAAARAGRVAQANIDAAVARVLTLKFRAGLFEHPLADPARAAAQVGDKANIPLAREVADKAMVLLRNEGGLLPLDPARAARIAVIGPNADKARLGGYSAMPAYFVTVLDGIRRRVGPKVTVSYAEGVRISEPDKDPIANKIIPFKAPSSAQDQAGIAKAVTVARDADLVILVLGDNETVTREAFGGMSGGQPSLGDTDNLNLPGRQDELVRAVAALGKPTVAVLLNGRARSIEELSRTVPAIVEGWYLGQETGNAVAGLLFGDVNPSGRLPLTIPRNVGQLPVFYNHKPQARLGYVNSDITPLYPFGYGLSYTSFTYGKVSVDRPVIARNGSATASVTVTNAGQRAGDEVVQMYVHPRVSSTDQPVLRLAGFEKVHLKAGETRTVRFPVGPEQLAIWDRRMKRVVEPGTVDVMVGPNARDHQSVALEVRP